MTASTARIVGRAFVRGLAVVIAAYVLAYGLIRALPEFGTGVLGLAASDPNVMERFRLEKDVPASIGDALIRVIRGEHGKSLDDRPVPVEIAQGIRQSLPLFAASIALTALCAVFGAFFGARNGSTATWVARLLAFLPAYLPAYVAIGALPLLSVLAARSQMSALCIVAALTAAIPGAMIFGTVAATAGAARQAPSYMTLLAHGYSIGTRFRLIGPTIYKQLLPMLARVVSTVIMVQVFVEAVLAYPGLGTSLLQALRRTDINLVLGYVLLLSTLHVSLLQIAAVVRLIVFGTGR